MLFSNFDLAGKWHLQKNGKGKKIPANVPGDVYSDLLQVGYIPDPFFRDNELALQWIGKNDWTYSRSFMLPKTLLSKKNILLRCEGLDTFTKITINGKLLSKTDNMFRTYEWDLKKFLKSGKNTIRIDFASVLPYIEKKRKKFPEWTGFDHWVAYPGWVRKEQCNFGWDWGLNALTCGIWRNIQIIAFDEQRLKDVFIHQKHEKNLVKLDIQVSTEGTGKDLKTEITVLNEQKVVKTDIGKVFRENSKVNINIRKPKLWWPNNMGEQNLYTIKVELKNSKMEVIDTVEKRIGLRKVELDRHEDEWGESFQFMINRVPFFAKGANWIPVDAILARRTPEIYQKLIRDAADCNMNMLRVWGGGIYEDDIFYEICDELGICVWQDFMFACASYPIFEKKFITNVKSEIRDNIKRLRHHPSLTLWCGNNELEMMNVGSKNWEDGKMPWKDYKLLFDDLIPQQIKELSPEIPYWPSSPHSPKGDRKKHRNHLCGDAHLWIMSGKYPFDCAKGMEHRFASEFGFQSFPEPKTVNGYTFESDNNISSRIMEHHQRAPGGNITLMQQILKCLRMPNDFKNTLWVSQIMQGTGVKNACEHFRRSMPRCMGALYWQLNDCWPVASWASIDFNGRWKAMQYMAKKFFAPILISGVENQENNSVDIHLTSDRLKSFQSTVSWTFTDIEGNILEQGEKNTKTPVNGNRIVKTLPLKKLLREYNPNNLLLWIEADTEGETINSNVVFFAPPKHMGLNRNPGIKLRIKKNKDGSFTILSNSLKVALWTWIELDGIDAVLSNNFFHLRPEMTETVLIKPYREMTTKQFKNSLIIRSLINTY